MKGLIKPMLLAIVVAAMQAGTAIAQEAYPTKPIRVIVPYPAGGVVDLFARVVTEAISKRWAQPIIVDARPGAASNIGTQTALQSDPDGHTWLMAGPGLMANPSLFKTAKWDPVVDFTGVGVAGYSPLVLVVNDKFAAKTLRDVAALAQAKPGTIATGTMNGSSVHFVLEAFKQSANINLLMVPYKGAPPVVTDLINGTLQLTVLPLAVAHPQIESKNFRALAIASTTRSSLLPDVPTFAEAGFPEGVLVPWYGFVVRRATSPDIVKAINAAINEALASPEVRDRLIQLGGEPGRAMSTAEIDMLIKADFENYTALIKRGNITAE